MKPGLAAAAFLLALVAAVVALAPATLADARLAATTQGALRLADAKGTLWSGEGTLMDAAGTWRTPVQWRLSPVALLAGEAIVDLGPSGRVFASGTRIAMQDVKLRLPAAALAVLVPAALAVSFGGDLDIDARSLTLDGGGGDGALAVSWTRARLVLPQGAADLGTVSLRATPRANEVVATIANTGGDVALAGTVTSSRGAVTIDATLTPAPTLAPELARALVALGRPDPNGAVRIAWRGRLP